MKFLREFVVLGMLAAASAQAAPKNIDDCEKIKEPMAYNECLASFGPAVGHVGSGQSYAPASEGGAPRAAVGKGRRARAYHAPARRGGDGDAWSQWADAHGVHAVAEVRTRPKTRSAREIGAPTRFFVNLRLANARGVVR